MPSSNSAARARSKPDGVAVRALTARAEAMPKRLLVQPAGAVVVDVAGALVGAGEPGADHDVRRPGGQGQGDVARVPDAAVGPHVLAERRGRRRRTPRRRRTAAGRRRSSSAWCTWRPGPTPTLTTSAPASIEVAGALGGDHVAGHDRRRPGDGRARRAPPRPPSPGGRARCRRRARRRRRPAGPPPCRRRRR